MIEHPHTTARANAEAERLEARNAQLRAVVEKFGLMRDPEWLDDIANSFNRYPWNDARHEPTQMQIERRRAFNANSDNAGRPLGMVGTRHIRGGG